MSGNQRGRGGGRGDSRGGRGGGQGGSRADFQGGRGGGRGDFQGGRGGGRGDFQGGRGGPREDFQGGRGGGPRGDFRGGRGRGGPQQMPFRGPREPAEEGGIYLSGVPPSPPNPNVTALENALVQVTCGQTIPIGEGEFPGRSGYGTKGREIILRTNYFQVQTALEAKEAKSEKIEEKILHRYDVSITPELSRPKNRRFMAQLIGLDIFNDTVVATDYGKTIVTTSKLKLTFEKGLEGDLILADPNQGAPQTTGNVPAFVQAARDRNKINFRITYQGSFTPEHMVEFLRSRSLGAHYDGRDDIIQMLNIIMCKAPNSAANVAALPGNKFYPHQGHPGIKSMDLKQGLMTLRGYFSSVRPAVGRLLVNLNVTSGAFYKSLPVIQLLDDLRSRDLLTQEAFLRMLKVRAEYNKPNEQLVKFKTIIGFAKTPDAVRGKKAPLSVKRFGNAREVKFRYVDRNGANQQERETTVFDYFKNFHGITLQRPDLPVLNVGTRSDPQYMPQEICTVLPGQPYRRLLSSDQTTVMLGFAARFPNQNALSIAGSAEAPGDGLRLMRLRDPPDVGDPQLSSIQPFGFRVATDMLTVPGRILNTPTVTYGNRKTVRAQGGSWNLTELKFFRPGSFTKWSVLVLNHQGPRGIAMFENPTGEMSAPETIFKELEKHLSGYGMTMGRRANTTTATLQPLDLKNRPSNDKVLDGAFAKFEQDQVPIVLVVLPEADKWLYARIKYYADTRYGIHTICAVGSKLQKPKGQGMYLGNLALKFNIKGGGVNHTVADTLVKPLDNNTMMMGIDVTHPSPGSSKGAPSIACVVASKDSYLCQWPGSIRKQRGKQEMVGEEERKGGDMVNGLEEMVLERLDCWVRTNKQLPNRIVVYRDGVSEGQYALVLQRELPSFHKAFARVYGDAKKWPKVAIIVVGKRHHTRFYPTNQKDANFNPNNGKGSWNSLPGTIVDRGIAGKFLREFWLQAHQGLQGTARSAHYVVIKDDIGIGADDLEQITHHLSYMFSRATKAVSIVPPAYYADILAERGRAYLFTTLQENHASEGSTASGGQSEWDGKIHPRLKDSTWYV